VLYFTGKPILLWEESGYHIFVLQTLREEAIPATMNNNEQQQQQQQRKQQQQHDNNSNNDNNKTKQ